MAVIIHTPSFPSFPPFRHAMNLPSQVLNIAASYSSWQPLHTITPPWSSKPSHPTMTTLPPITSLQRQHHHRDTARQSYSIFLPLNNPESSFSAASSNPPSTTPPTSCLPNSSSSLGRVARFLTLLCLGTEASNAPSRQCTVRRTCRNLVQRLPSTFFPIHRREHLRDDLLSLVLPVFQPQSCQHVFVTASYTLQSKNRQTSVFCLLCLCTLHAKASSDDPTQSIRHCIIFTLCLSAQGA